MTITDTPTHTTDPTVDHSHVVSRIMTHAPTVQAEREAARLAAIEEREKKETDLVLRIAAKDFPEETLDVIDEFVFARNCVLTPPDEELVQKIKEAEDIASQAQRQRDDLQTQLDNLRQQYDDREKQVEAWADTAAAQFDIVVQERDEALAGNGPAATTFDELGITPDEKDIASTVLALFKDNDGNLSPNMAQNAVNALIEKHARKKPLGDDKFPSGPPTTSVLPATVHNPAPPTGNGKNGGNGSTKRPDPRKRAGSTPPTSKSRVRGLLSGNKPPKTTTTP